MMEQNFDEDLINQRTPLAEVAPRLQNHFPAKPNYWIQESLQKELKVKHKKQRTLSIIQSTAKFEKQKEVKIKEMRAINQSNQMKECTFEPSINKSKAKKRTLKQFLHFQNQFTQKVEEKKEALQKRMKENDPVCSFRPKINSNSKVSKIPTHERLYNISKEQQITERSTTETDFIPSITSRGKQISRTLPFHESLYADALRRQQNAYKDDNSLSPIKQTSITNEKLVAQKVIRQYCKHIENFRVESLDFEQFTSVFYKMGFLSSRSDEQEITEKERRLLLQAFEQTQVPTLRNVCVLILALIGIYNINPINFSKQEENMFELNYTIQSGRKLQKYFDLFFRNRLSLKHSKSKTIPNEPAFKPQINQNTETLANYHRSRMLEQTSVMIESTDSHFRQGTFILAHPDLLHLNKLAKDAENAKKKEERELQKLKDCTFYPNLSTRQSNKKMKGIQKSSELYQKSKYIVKQNKDIVDRQYEQNKKQCTFKPNIHKAPRKVQVNEEPAPDFNKSIARLFEGRRMKNQKSNSHFEQSCTPPKTQRTSHNKSKNNNKKSEETEPPFLIIDINLIDSIQQILIYKNDLYEARRLGQQFADRHRLDVHSKEKLIKLLEIEIHNFVNQIIEEDEGIE